MPGKFQFVGPNIWRFLNIPFSWLIVECRDGGVLLTQPANNWCIVDSISLQLFEAIAIHYCDSICLSVHWSTNLVHLTGHLVHPTIMSVHNFWQIFLKFGHNNACMWGNCFSSRSQGQNSFRGQYRVNLWKTPVTCLFPQRTLHVVESWWQCSQCKTFFRMHKYLRSKVIWYL